MAVNIFRDITEAKRAEDTLRRVTEAERTRIARDLHDGVLQDLSYTAAAMGLIMVEVDDASLTVDVLAGTFGTDLEDELRGQHGLTVGHWPQSIAISTVGGWIACRGAGQYSTRYGKIEDIVRSAEVVLATGDVVDVGHGPAAPLLRSTRRRTSRYRTVA